MDKLIIFQKIKHPSGSSLLQGLYPPPPPSRTCPPPTLSSRGRGGMISLGWKFKKGKPYLLLKQELLS